jgi:hypothetical protein
VVGAARRQRGLPHTISPRDDPRWVGAVYSQKGAVYGSGWEKETYLAAEAEAQSVLSPFLMLFFFPNLLIELLHHLLYYY